MHRQRVIHACFDASLAQCIGQRIALVLDTQRVLMKNMPMSRKLVTGVFTPRMWLLKYAAFSIRRSLNAGKRRSCSTPIAAWIFVIPEVEAQPLVVIRLRRPMMA